MHRAALPALFNRSCFILARRWPVLCLAIFLLLGAALHPSPVQATSLAPTPLVLEDSAGSVDAWPALGIQDDPGGLLSAQVVLSIPERFTPPTGPASTLGMQDGAVWLRLPVSVADDSDGQWVLKIDHPPLNRIDVYLVTQGRIVREAVLGSTQPHSDRPLRTLSHSLPLTLEAGQNHELLLRVQSHSAFILPITLEKPAHLLNEALHEQMLHGVLIGLGLCFILYSLFQWISLREPLFIMYVLMTTGSLLFTVYFFGVGAQYLWPNSPLFEQKAGGLFSLTAIGGSFLFIGQILAGDQTDSRFLRIMRGGAALSALLAVAYMGNAFGNKAVAGIVTILGLAPSIMGIPRATRLAISGNALGFTLLLAWLTYLGTTAIVIGIIQGWVPVNFWSLHAFEFGTTIDMVLFMHVLGLRSKALRLAAKRATMERDAMQELAHSDALTGLPNRRGLDLALTSAMEKLQPDRLLAVYVMDLDGFKPVNDQHGHDVGDELLVAVAKRLQGHVRDSDVVARLGGDEFVVVASQMQNPQQVQALGEKLLQAFQTPFSLSKVHARVGLTIGYAMAPTDSLDPYDLIKFADMALYEGKHAGKLCVRRYVNEHMATQPPAPMPTVF